MNATFFNKLPIPAKSRQARASYLISLVSTICVIVMIARLPIPSKAGIITGVIFISLLLSLFLAYHVNCIAGTKACNIYGWLSLIYPALLAIGTIIAAQGMK
tara:strand:+ start:1947 stop:2252 length:306 start_codon:yes stop_codon:yes gene_type:complete